ncbi:MAG TPA: AraC family transcriptional regulator ligand-binding domain-containing protein [Limnobacter sp.]|nr:AraC family transcriptional regulator ligand-binding domain-containing protein [Limnobacter sp.]
METINFRMLASLANAARRCDIDLNEVMQALNLDIDMSGDPKRRMSLACFNRLFEAVDLRKPVHHFPLVFGDSFNFDGLPELATFVTSASTPQEAMRVLEWSPKLLHPNLTFSTSQKDGELALEIGVGDPLGEHNDLPGFVEAAVAAVLKFMRLLSPHEHLMKRVEFRHAPMASVEEYTALLKTSVHFLKPSNRLVVDAHALDLPLPGGIPSAHLQAQAVILNRLLPEVDELLLSKQLHRMYKSRLSLLSESLEGIASQLNMHPRTMQRRLKEEGTSFVELLAKVRHELACEMLSKSVLDIESIATNLGYSDRRSFTSAFIKWQGVTPREFRNRA